MLYDIFVAPIADYIFMQRALLSCVAISFVGGPVGVLLVLKRMNLLGEALSHGILPGIAISALLFGVWMPGFLVGAMTSGLLIAWGSYFSAKKTVLTEDAGFGGFYLIAMALGVMILSLKKGNFQILHLLFGNILSVTEEALHMVFWIVVIVLVFLLISIRPIVFDAFDPVFMQVVDKRRFYYQGCFWAMVIILLVAASMTIGTLMALGLIMLPALTARILVTHIHKMFFVATFLSIAASYLGLITSYHYNLPSGPAIILICGGFFMLAVSYAAIASQKN
ncbi:MAG: metal ABC transporter permease [Pseudomonadota bacterium]